MAIENPKLKDYPLLKEMYLDNYYPTELVDKGKRILVKLCEAISNF